MTGYPAGCTVSLWATRTLREQQVRGFNLKERRTRLAAVARTLGEEYG